MLYSYFDSGMSTDVIFPVFIPAPSLHVDKATVSVVFLTSTMRYLHSQRDPLFATDSNFTTSGKDLFIRKLPPAALGCVYREELCIPSYQHDHVCVNITVPKTTPQVYELPSNQEEGGIPPSLQSDSSQAILEMGRITHDFTNPGSAFAFSFAPFLDASNKVIMPGLSADLPPNQWQIETQKIFNWILANVQLSVWKFARGQRPQPDIPVYERLENSSSCAAVNCKKLLCESIKIQAVGWKNISLFWFVSLLFISVILVTGSIEVGETLLCVLFAKGVVWILQHTYNEILIPESQWIRKTARECIRQLWKVPKIRRRRQGAQRRVNPMLRAT